MTKVFLAGTFDTFHIGHQYMVWTAQSMGDELVVIIARDTTVEKLKKQVPKYTEQERKERVVAEQVPNSCVMLGRNDGKFLETLRDQNPDIICLGYDQKVSEELLQEVCPNAKIIRLNPYYPEYFKSSLFRELKRK